MKKAFYIAAVASLVLVTSCATRPMGSPSDPAFIRGLIDGLLAPISFVLSLFSDTIRMYQFPNIGRWYDFGFLIGISAWGGGGSHVVTRFIYVDRTTRRRIGEDVVD